MLSKPGESVDPGLATEVTWAIKGRTLRRTEIITALQAVRVRRIWMAVPTRANRVETSLTDGVRRDRLISKEGTMEVRVLRSDWPVQSSAFATGDDPLGRGDRGPIPLHVILETMQNLTFSPGAPERWDIEFSILGDTDF